MRWWLPLAFAALWGCNPSGQPDAVGVIGDDGYFMEDVSQRINPTITVIIYPDRQAMRAAHPANHPENLMAFTVISADGKRCTIHVVDPAERYKPTWLGHELTHCIYGQWHPSQGASGTLVSVRSNSNATVR